MRSQSPSGLVCGTLGLSEAVSGVSSTSLATETCVLLKECMARSARNSFGAEGKHFFFFKLN